MTKPDFDFGSAVGHLFVTFGRRPGGTLWVALWNAILMTAVSALIILTLWPAFSAIWDISLAGREPSPNEVWGILAPFMAAIPLSFLGGVAAALMAQGAWLRLLTRNEVAAGIPLRFGGDELRLLGVNLIYFILGLVVYVAFIIVAAIIALIVGGSDGGMAAGATAGLLGGLFVLFGMVALLYLAIKLSAAPALTVHDRKLHFFESWSATQKVFWWILLSYLVMLIIIFATQMILGTVVQFIFLGAFIPLIMEMAQLGDSGVDDPQVFLTMLQDQFSNPATLVVLGIGVLLSLMLQTLTEALWHSVGAYTAIRHRTDVTPVAAPEPASTGDTESGSTAPDSE